MNSERSDSGKGKNVYSLVTEGLQFFTRVSVSRLVARRSKLGVGRLEVRTSGPDYSTCRPTTSGTLGPTEGLSRTSRTCPSQTVFPKHLTRPPLPPNPRDRDLFVYLPDKVAKESETTRPEDQDPPLLPRPEVRPDPTKPGLSLFEESNGTHCENGRDHRDGFYTSQSLGGGAGRREGLNLTQTPTVVRVRSIGLVGGHGSPDCDAGDGASLFVPGETP